MFDHGCLLAQELIEQLLQLVEGLGQTLSAQQVGDRGATGEEAHKDSLLGVLVLITRKFRQGAFDDGALFAPCMTMSIRFMTLLLNRDRRCQLDAAGPIDKRAA